MLCTVALRAAGCRAVGREGQHQVVVEALPLIMGAAQIDRSRYYHRCRRRRGDVVYDAIPAATEREVEELVGDLGQFKRQVIGWLRQDHPELMKA